jgi:hypothetical protein
MTLKLRWRQTIVGTVEDEVPDMAYVEGRFRPESSSIADEFLSATERLRFSEVFDDLRRGLKAEIEEGDDDVLAVVIFQLSSGRITFKRIFDSDLFKALEDSK